MYLGLVFFRRSESIQGMYQFGRSIRALLRSRPKFPGIAVDAFVFGAAPDPEVPPELLRQATVLTTNASQVWLERFGVTKPDVVCMRGNMAIGTETDVLKVEALRDRQAGLLVLFEHKSDPGCKKQLELLRSVNFRFEDHRVLDRVDRCVVHNRVLEPGSPLLLKHYEASAGLNAVLLALLMGARRVAVAGVSFRNEGCSYLDLKYERIHVDGDMEILGKLKDIHAPVYATDQALSEDAGIPLWPGGQSFQASTSGTTR